MVFGTRNSRLNMSVLSLGRRRATRCLGGVAVAAASMLGSAVPAVASTAPTLGVVIVGSGRVTSQPHDHLPGEVFRGFPSGHVELS